MVYSTFYSHPNKTFVGCRCSGNRCTQPFIPIRIKHVRIKRSTITRVYSTFYSHPNKTQVRVGFSAPWCTQPFIPIRIKQRRAISARNTRCTQPFIPIRIKLPSSRSSYIPGCTQPFIPIRIPSFIALVCRSGVLNLLFPSE